MDTPRDSEKPGFSRFLFPLFLLMLALPLYIKGIEGSVWCYNNHICMAGHMRHPPYPEWHYRADTAWAAALLAGAALSVLSGAWITAISTQRRGRILGWAAFGTAAPFVVLVIWRFACGSAGGIFSMPV